jgi:hypothetical protein
MEIFGNVTNNGIVNIQTGRSAYFFNTVSGNGSFTGGGTAVFLASLSPGNSPGSISFGGDVALVGGSSLNMELFSDTPATGYDQIDVAGTLSIGGILSVALIGGFMPAIGSSFNLLDWGTLEGTFSAINLPALATGQWDTSQLYTTGVLSVIASPLGGDYNDDGAVDAADYVLWRKGGPLKNEVDNPGTVDEADYAAWQARFGTSAGGGGQQARRGNVPEPASAALMLLAAIATSQSVRRRK